MRWIITAIIALAAGFVGAAAWDFSGLGTDSTRSHLMADPETRPWLQAETRGYLLENPEVLPAAMAELQRRDTAQRIAPVRAELNEPYPGAVLGNPEGSITLVEFSDYACGFCKQSLADVNALIAQNPDLRVVMREYPVLSLESEDAARMALAAADQGRFEEFHNAMFAADGLSEAAIEAAARSAGVDLAQARAAIDAGTYDAQLNNNRYLGRSLGLSGTPAFILGDEVFNGAVGVEPLAEAIAEARDL